VKRCRPLCRVSSLLLKGVMRKKQAAKMECLAEECHGESPEACLALRETWPLTDLAYDVSPSSLKRLLCKVRTNDDCLGWSVIGLQVNLMLPWRKMGEPQSGDGAFSNTPPTAFRWSPS
jgi:hypothetical protein